MKELISKTEDSVIYYNKERGYYVEDRDDVCVIEEYNISNERLSNQAAIDVINWYKGLEEAQFSLLKDILQGI